MTVTADRRPARGPGVREAILDVAAAQFAEHGIRAVSADRILAEAGFSKVTFYRHFPTKDDAVVAYLERELARVRAVIEESGSDDLDRDALAAALTEEMCRPHFRGCPFINAAAEYPEPDHPVRRVVAEFRALMVAAIDAWLERRGVADRTGLAEQIMMLRDGALVAGYLDHDPDGVARALADAIGALVREAS
ncbi:TetR/AcrR family transcriptional regulator [Demequina rhizosphaerae]|uniref:TetR/AcrR family transcriptional regulator n=1 Tax=Demequina rhizosphaerae TaxID=1638985 RepID=UPI0007836540|nr:TetR/AcrR family transcriptional regulator [Demequina rhizosphaerae]